MFKIYHFLILFVVITTALPIYFHNVEHDKYNIYHMLLSFFLPLNSLIALWEISLGLNIDYIKQIYTTVLRKKYAGNKRFNSVKDFFLMNLSLSNMFSLKFWSLVWSTYSLYDESYSNRESFGFFVDVGNGWTTLVPSLLYLYAMTYDIMPAKVLGIIGIIKFYQELYGTCIYFLSFILNKRYVGKTAVEVALFVVLTNGLWFFFPLVGIYTSVQIILADSLAVLR